MRISAHDTLEVYVSALRKYTVLAIGGALSILLVIEFLRLLQPAHARELDAACRGMRPADRSPAFGLISETARRQQMVDDFLEKGTWPSIAPPLDAPNFALKDQKGNTVTLQDLRGQLVVLNFWSSWCGVCRSEKPTLDFIQETYANKGLKVVAAASDSDWGAVRRAMFGLEVATGSQLVQRFKDTSPALAARFAKTPQGLFITEINSDRPAARAGLREFDQLLSVAGKPVSAQADIETALRGAGDEVSIVASRPDEQLEVTLKQSSPLLVLLDPPPAGGGTIGAIARSYGIEKVPESFVIDRQGKIRHYFINRRDWNSDIAVTCLRSLLDE
jgi:thiol-disulfide isomerase/thioredoxin